MMIRALQKSIYIRLLLQARKYILFIFAVILMISAQLTGCRTVTSNSYSLTPYIYTDNLEQPLLQTQRYNLNCSSQLTYGKFIWLLMNKLSKDSGNYKTMEQAVEGAKINGYCQSVQGLHSDITIQEAAQILINTKYEVYKIDISQFDWQIFDLDEADKCFRTNIINAYANGLLTTQNGYIQPRRVVGFWEALSILERLTDKSKRVLPPGIKVPYFEYNGLVEIIRLDPTIVIDLRYAATNNFTGIKHYTKSLCLMEADAAKALVKANNSFKKDGCFIKVWDAYRPVDVQWALYYAAPSNLKAYVPAPSKFSQHPKGIAADITLVDKYQNDMPMPTDFDSFSNKAHIDYNNLPENIIHNRKYLMSGMKQAGFSVNKLEWWHYYLPDKAYLPISKVTFDEFIKKRNEYYLQIIKQNQ